MQRSRGIRILKTILQEAETHKSLWQGNPSPVQKEGKKGYIIYDSRGKNPEPALSGYMPMPDERVLITIGCEDGRFGYFIRGNYYNNMVDKHGRKYEGRASPERVLAILEEDFEKEDLTRSVMSIASGFVAFLESLAESRCLPKKEVSRIRKELKVRKDE